MTKTADRANAPENAARLLLRRAVRGALATSEVSTNPERQGGPAASLITVATDGRGQPLFLLSDIAHHTQNLKADARAALLIDETAGFDNPQAGPRATFVGKIKLTRRGEDRRRFLARHPDAAGYAEFADFNFYQMAVERVHHVGGFARAQWLAARRVVLPSADCREVATNEIEIIDHMNTDHTEALRLIGQWIVRGRGKYWRMTGIDSDGMDLVCGATRHRFDFESPVTTAGECREVLVALAAKARAK